MPPLNGASWVQGTTWHCTCTAKLNDPSWDVKAEVWEVTGWEEGTPLQGKIRTQVQTDSKVSHLTLYSRREQNTDLGLSLLDHMKRAKL